MDTGGPSRRTLLRAGGLLATAGTLGYSLSPTTGESVAGSWGEQDPVAVVVYNGDATRHEVRVTLGDGEGASVADRTEVAPGESARVPGVVPAPGEFREYVVGVGVVDGPTATTSIPSGSSVPVAELHGVIHDGGRVRLSTVSTR